jgi:shikimate dehydrogenase
VNRLGVLGWPVAHSLSPAIQNAALAAVGLGDDWRYQLLPVPPEVFTETVMALPSQGFRGVNVTIPHKGAALELAMGGSGRAFDIGAANTLIFDESGIRADNTDAPALALELSRLIDLNGASVLVLGAGGSARAAVWALNHARAAEVRVWNRTPERAVELCAELGGTPVTEIAAADVLVNCTSVGLSAADELAMLPLPPGGVTDFGVIADLVYREAGAVLTRAAREHGVETVDGLTLLVAQGVLAFELFTGLPAPLDAMRAAVGLSSAR